MTADEFRLLLVTQSVPPAPGADPELDAVQAELYRLDPAGSGVAAVLRDTLDQLYDGQHTGRWNYDQLHKTEWPRRGSLAPNLLLGLDAATRDRIFGARAARGQQHGQARTNELFRSVQRRIIRRADLATVAQQDDFMKRARGNGGARTQLRAEGILVLGHQDSDPLIAAALGLPAPSKGEFISARVVAAQAGRDDPVAIVAGQPWALARAGDPVVPAPVVPRKQQPGQPQPGQPQPGQPQPGQPQPGQPQPGGEQPQLLADWPEASDRHR